MTEPEIHAGMDFFALLREAERQSPQLPRFGTVNDNDKKRLRLVQTADMAFASREVAQVDTQGERLHITLRHFGLFAPYGPLPIAITEHARSEQLSLRNEAFRDFIALLTQRHALLFYRAWNQLQPMTGYDHSPQRNPFLQRLRQIAGVSEVLPASRHLQQLRQTWPAAWLPGRGSLRDLQQMLSHYFSIPLHISSHQGRWFSSRDAHGVKQVGRLGETRLGKRFFDSEHTLNIDIGPLGWPEYSQWQRGEVRLLTLASLSQAFVRHRLLLEINLLIESHPELASHPAKLGRSSWLRPQHNIVRQRVWQTPT